MNELSNRVNKCGDDVLSALTDDLKRLEDVLFFHFFNRSRVRTQSQEREFGARVRSLRQELGISQAEFAKRYGLDLTTLRGWEQCRRAPNKSTKTFIDLVDQKPGIALAIMSGIDLRSRRK